MLKTTNKSKLNENKSDRDYLADTLSDMITNLFYYDRKEDENLPIGTIEQMVENGEVSVDEIVEFVSNQIIDSLAVESALHECTATHPQRLGGCCTPYCRFYNPQDIPL